MGERSDEFILSLCKNSETKDTGFTLLMNKYKEKVYWHIRRIVVSHHDAQDVLQETFINVYRHIEKFEAKSSVYTWLYRIAVNESIRLLNSKKIDTSSYEEMSRYLTETLKESAPESGDKILLKFQEAVLRLPEKQRLVFNLRYYDELPYDEISKILGSSVNALKTNYHLAVEKVKKFLINI
jgi:RNA polymerase sigma-70 factor (ECF subfamily)